MSFAGSTYEGNRGRLAYDGFMTVHTADEGRCHIDPKLQPVHTPGPAAHYQPLQRTKVAGMGFGASTSSRFAFNDTRVARARPPPQPLPSTLTHSGSRRAWGGQSRSGGGASSSRTPPLFRAGSGGGDPLGERPSTSDSTILTPKGSFRDLHDGQARHPPRRPSTSGNSGDRTMYWTFGDGRARRPNASEHGILFGFPRARHRDRPAALLDGKGGKGEASTLGDDTVSTPARSMFSSSQRYSPVHWRGVATDTIAVHGDDSPGPKYYPETVSRHHLVNVSFTDAARFQGPGYYVPSSRSPGPPDSIPSDLLTRNLRNERKCTGGARYEAGSIFGHVKHNISPGPIYAPWDSRPADSSSFNKSHHACARRGRNREPNPDWIH